MNNNKRKSLPVACTDTNACPVSSHASVELPQMAITLPDPWGLQCPLAVTPCIVPFTLHMYKIYFPLLYSSASPMGTLLLIL